MQKTRYQGSMGRIQQPPRRMILAQQKSVIEEERLRLLLKMAGATAHDGGTYICMEGPHFSTRAESRLYRSWGVDVIGMTNLQEAKLAREAELAYATVALVTDYDCWHEDEDDVSADAVMQTLAKNTANVRRVLEKAVPGMTDLAKRHAGDGGCGCHQALATAVLTA